MRIVIRDDSSKVDLSCYNVVSIEGEHEISSSDSEKRELERILESRKINDSGLLGMHMSHALLLPFYNHVFRKSAPALQTLGSYLSSTQ